VIVGIEITGDKEVIARLLSMPEKVHAALVRKVYTLAFQLQRKVQTEKLAGQVLNKRTGALQSSIFTDVQQTPYEVSGKVAASKSVPYAAIHEFGGKTRAHDILPNKAQALHFFMGGKEVFAKVVHHPGSVIPERSYLRSALGEMQYQIIQGLTEAVQEGLM
jgi:phage gpG-like protein